MPSSADPRIPPRDVLVVGAGPAGLAAAAAAAEAGADVAVIERGPRPGGQYWRHGPSDSGHQHGARAFAALRRRLERAGVPVLSEHHVQTVVPDGDGWAVRCLRGPDSRLSGEVVELRGGRLVLATGGYDRQLPFPGWDLPGVLTAGGTQALLKEHGVPAGRSVVVAGTGPFLLPVAAALLDAGVKVPLVAEAHSPVGFAHHPSAVLGAGGKLFEGAGYLARLARAGTPYRRRHAVIRALGDDRVEAVDVARLDRSGRVVDGTARTVRCDALAVGWGFTPHLELALQVGCATTVGEDGSLLVAVDDAQRTSTAGVWAAGEATGIGGWQLSTVEGEIAGAAAAGALPAPGLRRRRARLRRFAAAMHAVHPVPAFLVDDLADEVVVCRCEEVPAAELRAAVADLGATDARTVKLLSRAGMGWCQGRVCGFATACVTAAECHRSVDEVDLRAMAERPLAVPSTLRTLAAGGTTAS